MLPIVFSKRGFLYVYINPSRGLSGLFNSLGCITPFPLPGLTLPAHVQTMHDKH